MPLILLYIITQVVQEVNTFGKSKVKSQNYGSLIQISQKTNLRNIL